MEVLVMTIRIPAQLEATVREKARAQGVTVEAYIEQLIRDDEEWTESSEGPLQEDDPDFAKISEAVREALGQAECGDSRPAEEFFAELRAKNGIPR
jgi:hypothetical protein